MLIIYQALRNANWMGIKNLGFVEAQPSRFANDLTILGTINDLPRLVEEDAVSAAPRQRTLVRRSAIAPPRSP